jgi:hypothetical protein
VSEVAIARNGRSAPAWLGGGASVLWMACAVAMALLGYLAWVHLDLRKSALAILLLSVVLAAFAAVEPRLEGRARVFLDRFGRVGVLAVPLVATALVANAASVEPQLKNYWWWFALWVAAMATAVAPFVPRLDVRAIAGALRAHRGEALAVVGLIVAAALIRLVQLNTLPDPYSGDESTFGLAGLNALRGNIPNMFRSGVHGTPHMWFEYMAGVERLFGATTVGARSSSVVWGVLAIPVTYLFLREMFGRNVALIGAIFLAAYHFQVQFSRQSMPNIADTVLIPLVLWLAYRAIRDGRRIDYALMGLAMGLTLYTWVSARLLPFELAALWGWWLVTNQRLPGHLVTGGVVAVAIAIVAALPLGWWWYNNQGEFNTRFNQVSIHRAIGPNDVSWYDEQRGLGRSAFDIYKGQTQDTLDAVFFDHEDTGFYRTTIPLVDKWAFLPLLVGAAVALWRIRQPRYFLLLVMLGFPLITGGILTDPPVSSARLLGIIPAVAGLVGVGLVFAGEVAARDRRPAALAIALALVAGIGAYNLWYYFGKYPDERSYADINTRYAARYGQAVSEVTPKGASVYWLATDILNPGHPRLDFGLRDYTLTLIDESDKVVNTRNPNELPQPGPASAYLFAGKQTARAQSFAGECPGGSMYESQSPDTGQTDLFIYVTPPDACTYLFSR